MQSTVGPAGRQTGAARRLATAAITSGRDTSVLWRRAGDTRSQGLMGAVCAMKRPSASFWLEPLGPK